MFHHADVPDTNQTLFVSAQTQPFCMGHESHDATFLNAYNSNTLSHSLVFTGPEGIGKATYAFRLARFLLKNGLSGDDGQDSLFGDAPPAPDSMNVSADDPIYKQITSGAHPDLLYIERAYDNKKNRRNDAVRVDDVRRVNQFFRKTGAYGGWRIVIVDDADTMNINAQNAILKILEEPPKNSMIILIAHRMGTFLPTIRSRVQVTPFKPLSSEVLSNLLGQAGIDSPSQESLDFADGQFGRAMLFQDDAFTTISDTVKNILNGQKLSTVETHKLADSIGRAGQHNDFVVFETVLLSHMHHTIATTAHNNKTDETLLNTYDTVRDIFTKTKFSNLDKKTAVLQILSILKET